MIASAGWEETTIGNLVEFFDRKRVPLSSRERKLRQGGYPYYGASGIIDYIDDYIFDGKFLLIAEDGENLNSRKTPIAFFADGRFWVNNHAHIVRARSGRANDYFLKAWFDQANISGYITGAAQPKLSQANLKRIVLLAPDLPTQEKIAGVLSAYDDLIENNLRRIKILAETAQTLYREWFVKFRFQGHEEIPFVDSALGRIPEGWEVRTIGELCPTFEDGDWIETKDQGGSDYRLLQVSNIGVGRFIETGNFRFIKEDTFRRLRCTEVLPDDLLISRMPKPTGRAWLVTKMAWRMITAVDVAIARANPKKARPFFLLHHLNSTENLDLVEKHQTGTTRPRISRRNLGALPLVVPPLALQEQFGKFASQVYELITNLHQMNQGLRNTRDLLLPKLISGELDVSELDIAVPEEVT